MDQIITIRLTQKEWLEAIADYIGTDRKNVESINHCSVEITLKKPLK